MGERRVTADGRILEKLPDGTIIEVPQTPQQGAIPIGPRKTEATPSGYRRRPDGALEPIPGGPAIKTSYRQLTPSEAASRGLPPLQEGQFYQVSSEGSISVVGAPQRDRAYRPLPDSAAKRYEDSVSGYANLDRAISTFNPDYAGNTITGGLENSIQRRFDSFGTKGQAQWWADVNATDNALRNALFGASLTAGEQAAWDRTSIDPSMDPAQVKRNLEQRREIARGALSRKTAFLKANGYDPNAVDALAGEYAQNLSGQNIPQVANAMDQTYFMNDQREAVGFGEDMRRTSVPPELQAEWQGYMAQNFNGQMDPDAYARFRMGLDQKYNYGTEPGREQLYREEAQRFNDYYNRGGRTIVPIPGRMEKMSTLDVLKNSLANNPVTVTAANAADAATLGIPSLIDRTVGPGNMELLNNANPKSALFGQVVGSLAGTSGLGAAGKAVTSRLAPKLLGGEGGAALARGLATDGAYSGIYGANTGQDPLLSAITGVGGSALGRGVGTTAGAAIGGLKSKTAQAINKLGVTMTPGQLARASLENTPSRLGIRKMIAGIEDATDNTPFVNAAVRSARERSYQQGNQAMFQRAADGGPINTFGADALEQLDTLKNNAFSDAAEGVNIPLNEPRFIKQVGDANKFGIAQDVARNRGDWRTSMQQGMAPILGAGDNINGRQLQDALRYTQSRAGAWRRASNGVMPDPSAEGLSNAFEKMNDAFVSAAARNAPGFIPKLKQANRLYRNLKIMDNATGAAEGGVASPMQVINAIKANNSSLGQGRGMMALSRSPLYDTAATLQKVLPNKTAPTGVNAAPVLALLGAGTYGGGEATDSSTLKTLGGLMLATLPYTKMGAKTMNKALLDRPESLKALGAAINKRKGLFGAATIPFTLETQN